MKLCKDCKNVRTDYKWGLSHNKWDFAKCGRIRETKDAEIHPVSGRLLTPQSGMRYCTNERKFDNLCGPDAKYWEEKPTKTWFALNIASK